MRRSNITVNFGESSEGSEIMGLNVLAALGFIITAAGALHKLAGCEDDLPSWFDHPVISFNF